MVGIVKQFPLVSVIIPMYNAEKFISATIQNVLEQTYPNIELIVVDDGSRDNSLSVAKKFESKKVKILTQSNKGASAARNYGLREASGNFIQFLDADDLLSPNKIEEQTNLLLGNETVVAVCPTIHFFDGEDFSSKTISDEWYCNSFNNPVEFLIRLYGGYETEGAMIQPNSWLTPKKIIDRAGFWDERLSLDDDGEFFCRVILASTGIVCSVKAINYYRKFYSNQSLSSKTNAIAVQSALLSLELKQQHLSAFYNYESCRKAFARSYKRMAIQVYPQFKGVAEICVEKLKELGGTNHNVIIGGKGIELIKRIFGWKTARSLQYLSRKIKFTTN